MLEVIPMLAGIAIAAGSAVLLWYSNLTPEQQAAANRRAVELARSLFKKVVEHLTRGEADKILSAVQRAFG